MKLKHPAQHKEAENQRKEEEEKASKRHETTDNLQQSLERSGDNSENKGEEAALTILELLGVFKQIQGA